MKTTRLQIFSVATATFLVAVFMTRIWTQWSPIVTLPKSDNCTKQEAHVPTQTVHSIPKRGVPRDMLPQDPSIKTMFDELTGPDTKQDDPRLITFIRDFFLDAPRPYLTKLSHPLYKTPQAVEVDRLLKHKKRGFYVECGGFDGECSSNTIWLEHKLQWTGLIIEMDPSFYLQIRGKNRRSHTVNACLSPVSYSTRIPFREKPGSNGELVPKAKKKSPVIHETFCFPFYSVMVALNVSHIDYFSLDVEGQELSVLKTIPFDKMDISVLTVEYLHSDKQGIIDLMEKNAYRLEKTLDYANEKIWQWSFDYVFVKKDFNVTL